ncbi:hypothetical protein MNQ95_08825 [Pseudoxanthomonas daejeonensis]|uniref:hypothetical protein n=1 Tax=Pseudoxanthomonas daejeonensis TaxID=266062 RepID=UPI001F54775C|nr:hypothetical protein [Pseudoxanthomonas daejeonensis]UNK56279.1 hypothetical protein MNQ95_08825 [Pseudoxanthomonas daejeonensis]
MKAFSRVMLVLMVVFSVVHAIDFIAYGQKLQSALACVGFGLMAYGAWRNPWNQATAAGAGVRNWTAQVLSTIGIVLVLVSFVLRYVAA